MPDVLRCYTVHLAGETTGEGIHLSVIILTCLAGDVIGDYSFEKKIEIGDYLVFEDMAIYSMVKNNTFQRNSTSGYRVLHEDGKIEIVKEFGYEDFKGRLS